LQRAGRQVGQASACPLPARPTSSAAEFPLLGLEREGNRIALALRRRQPLLVLGPAGSGKTALLRVAIARSGQEALYLKYSASLHRLLADLARLALPRRAYAYSKETSVRLKGLLWTALEAEPKILVLDGVERAGFPTYRFFQRLYHAEGMALIVAARNATLLGVMGRLFWDPRASIHIPPLTHAHASQLFDLAAGRFGLGHLDLEEFRGKALESANGNPGQIIEMCRLASNPIYVSGRHIKLAPLRMDVLMKFI
jgi:ATPase family associated with various cellular activities (AAA)